MANKPNQEESTKPQEESMTSADHPDGQDGEMEAVGLDVNNERMDIGEDVGSVNHTKPEESDQNCNVNVSTDYGNQHFAEPNDDGRVAEEFEGDFHQDGDFDIVAWIADENRAEDELDQYLT